MTGPLLQAGDLDRLRTAFESYTLTAVDDVLGAVGRSALARGDLAGVAHALRGVREPTATLLRLFVVGAEVAEDDAVQALHPLPGPASRALIETSAGTSRAVLDVRPYGRDGWWVVSDLGSDVRPGPLAEDHVLGVGTASLTLAQAVVPGAVGRALDIGTGCGIQALHLSTRADAVVATDSSRRALTLAATTAALSGLRWKMRRGSFDEPVRRERFDLVVANPPFVVSPGTVEHEYRDSGLAGDDVSRLLVGRSAALLEPGGTAQLLANWIVPADGSWQERLLSWLRPTGCDAWVWQREVAEPGEYVELWLRDAGHRPGTPEWQHRYDTWRDWFVASGAVGVGMGLISLRRAGRADPVVVCEDVPQAYEQPAGEHVSRWFDRAGWLADCTDDELLDARVRPAPDLALDRSDLLAGPDGWQTRRAVLRQSHGLRWSVEVDDAVRGVVAACGAGASPRLAVRLAALALGADATEVAGALVPVLRDLVARGVLEPSG